MADDTTDTTAPPSAAGMDPALLQRLLGQLTAAPPPAPPQPSASSHEGRGWVSLLGEALGGGQQYGSTAEREQGGLGALLAFGARGLQASDYSYQPHTLGAIVGQGLDAARGSLGQTQAVSAARAAAAYDQQRQGQQDQLARIKEALPLLTLQQKMQQMQGLPPTLAGGGSIGTAGGGDGSFLSALAGIESGDQNIVSRVDKDSKGLTLAQGGNPAEISQGHFQINPGTWLEYAKQAGVDTTQYPTPMSAPREVQAQVASVIPLARFGPRTQEMLRQKFGDLDTSRTIGALSGAHAPPAPPSRAPAAPPGAPTPGTATARPTLPAPEAPIAPQAGAQVAGPGAPTTGGPAPTMPGTAADVADIRAGMVGAGADPTTLAPGPGSAPAPGGVVVAAGPGGGPTAPAPDSYEAYQQAHPIAPPSTDQQRLFNAQPDADQLRQIAEQKKNAELLYQQARRGADPAAAGKAREDYNAILDKENTLRENARKLAVEQQARWIEQQDKQRFDAWTKERDDARKQADAARAQADAIRLKEVEGEQARQTGAAASENSYVLDERKAFGTERDASRQSIDDVQVLRALSSAAGTAGTVEQMHLPNGMSVRDFLVQRGWGSDEAVKRWSTQQAFEQAANQMIISMRKGVQMGQLSDRDMSFIQSLVPRLSQNPATRDNILATIENAQSRKREYIDTTEQLWDGGKGMTWGQAKREADKRMAPVVPQIPQEYSTMSQSDRLAWFQRYAAPGTIFRGPDKVDKDGRVTQRGDIMVAPDPNAPGGTR